MYAVISKASDPENPKDVRIDVENGSDYMVGKTKSDGQILDHGAIDIGDITAFGSINNKSGVADAASPQGKLAHEIEENYQLQVVGEKDWDTAHTDGINAENAVNGSVRDPKGDHFRGESMVQKYEVGTTKVEVITSKHESSKDKILKAKVYQYSDKH